MQHLKPYFGSGSGYDEAMREEVITKIDAFLDAAQRLGITPKEASRAARKG
jgi:hypothetical protein